MVIKGMVRQFALPIEIVGAATYRAQDGLALSSRNGYLSADERVEAVQLSRTLQHMAMQVRAGETDWRQLENQAMQALTARGWQPDYLSIRRQIDLQAPVAGQPLVVLGAARIGSTRLIDNLEI
jgi:pantoate--beta-alanine ligase